MQRHFDEELKLLKEKLLQMSGLVEEAISMAIQALMERDRDLCQKVIKNDDPINMLEIEIDDLCLKLLALHQPQAGDLRFITSTMKINNDLERIGDLAVNIAQRAMDLMKVPPLKSLSGISEMAKEAQGMLRDSLNAFVEKDSVLALAVCKRDDIVDNFNRKIFLEFLRDKPATSQALERALDVVLVSKNLERIGDHSTNICEDVIYLVEGRVIKHHLEEKHQREE